MIYLVLTAVLWGSSFPVITYALRDTSPMVLLVLRFALAFVIMLPLYRRGGSLRNLFRRDIFLISLPNALSFILQFKAQELTTASKAALFVNSSPVFVVLLSTLFLHVRFSNRQLVAMVVALAGVVITSTRLDFSDLSQINIGDIMCVVVGLCWAIFIIYAPRAVRRYGKFQLAQGLYFWTMILASPLLFFETTRFSPQSLPAVMYLAVVTTVLAYFLYLKGTASVSTLSTSIIILIEVVVAFLISHFFLGESFSRMETVGVVLVMIGVVLVLQPRRASKTADAQHG